LLATFDAKAGVAIELVMQVTKVGFQQAVHPLEALAQQIQSPRLSPLPPTQSAPASEHVASKILRSPARVKSPSSLIRGLLAARRKKLARYEAGYYDDPARRSVYSGSVMVRIGRMSDGE
jgi:hypothetical protein